MGIKAIAIGFLFCIQREEVDKNIDIELFNRTLGHYYFVLQMKWSVKFEWEHKLDMIITKEKPLLII